MNTKMNLLEGTRARGAFTLRTKLSAPWSIRIAPEAPLTLIVGVKQSFWVTSPGISPIEAHPGSAVIVRPNVEFVMADSPERAPSVTVFKGQDCRDDKGNSVNTSMMLGARTWGNDPDGETSFVFAAYEHLSEISDRLLKALPPVLAISHQNWHSPLVGLLGDEVCRDEPGQAAVLDRIVDLLLTSALQAWLAKEENTVSKDWRAKGDPIISRALSLMYEEPARPWTIEELSVHALVSRATLARRFHEVVGEPPMAFLTNHRMALAADMLQSPGQTLATVALKVGYNNPFAFSVAFKRSRGISPKDFRLSARIGNPGLNNV